MTKLKWMVALLIVPTMLLAASPGDVVINEAMWMGASSYLDEWIELYNTTASAIDLTGWYILDDVTTTYNLSGTIPANGYYLIEAREEATNIPADLVVSSMNLANGGDQLELCDASANSIDLVSCGSGWYAGFNGSAGNDYSMERIDPAGPDNASNWADNDGVTQNGLDSGGLPLHATPTMQNSVYNPGGGDIDPPELERAYAMGAATVDVVFNEPVEPISAENAGNYSLFPAVSVNLATLDASDPTIVHLTTGAMTVGTLYTLTVSDIADTAFNYMEDDAEYDFLGNITPISMVKEDLTDGDFVPDLLGTQVTIQGIVSSGDSTFQVSHSDFYVQDATGGIDCFHYGYVHGVEVGDELIVSGVVDQYNGLTELYGPLALETLSTGNPVDHCDHVYTVNYVINNGEEVEGWLGGIQHLDKVSGTWPSEGSSANLTVTDDGGASLIVLRIDSDTDIDGTPEPAWPIDVAGIFGQYDWTTPPDSGYQLLPRMIEDLYPDGGLCHNNPGDWCPDPIVLPGVYYWSESFDLCDYMNDYDLEPCTGWESDAPDMVIEFTWSQGGPNDIYVLVLPSTMWDISVALISDCGDFGPTSCIDGEDANGPGWSEAINVCGLPDGTYYIVVSGFMSACGEFDICISSNNPLPVELVSFEGIAGDGQVELTWRTASETNNDHFYLVRSIDARNYARISGDIAATNSPTGSTYSYIDDNVVNGTTYYYKLADVDINGQETLHGIVVEVTPSGDASLAPDEYALYQNYPNPFNPDTRITYDVKETGYVTLKVFDVLGREVVTLVDGSQAAARYSVEFDATDLASGIYFYQIKVNDFSDLKKMVVLK
jgi:hypothetical protein